MAKLPQEKPKEVTAQMPQVGTKFGRWLDLTFMQLQLDERTEPDAIG